MDIHRRIRLDLITPEELAIYNLVREIEMLGAHPLLTEVVVLLAQARSKLADWVELPKPFYCAKCGYMATYPTCTKCGHPFVEIGNN